MRETVFFLLEIGCELCVDVELCYAGFDEFLAVKMIRFFVNFLPPFVVLCRFSYIV